MRVAIAGRSGLIGRAVDRAAVAAGHHSLHLPRIAVAGGIDDTKDVPQAVERWLAEHPDAVDEISQALQGADVLINAAGRADPAGANRIRLFEANALLPGILADIAGRAGVRRMIHVSSSAVQQKLSFLDESPRASFMTPYAESKAAAETLLLEDVASHPPEMVLYRPTSVQACDRPITRRLVTLASKKVLPLPGGGRAKLPLCLLENLAAGVVHVIKSPISSPIVLQPWEGVTTKLMFQLMGTGARFVPVPRLAVTAPLAAGCVLARRNPRLTSLCHNLELLSVGKEQRAEALPLSGFEPPIGLEGYRQLAEQVRRG